MQLWLTREVAFHPRGYYRLALSLARRWQVQLYGHPFPSIVVEGPLEKALDYAVWAELTAPPTVPAGMEIKYLRAGGQGNTALSAPSSPPPQPSISPTAPLTIICNPADLWRRFPAKKLLWDVWEDYEQNFRHDPAYPPLRRIRQRFLWKFLLPLRRLPTGYTLAEYAYAPRFPLHRVRFLPNAFVAVESAPPLLPGVAGSYTLYTGNLTESWGIVEVLRRAQEAPDHPFIVAGSVKDARVEGLIRQALHGHRRWLWIRSRFVPYPIIQNLQRYAALLYALYQPLPHLRDKIPGKFYEAAALGIPIMYPEGKSAVWDAFWRRYRGASDAPELYWTHYEGELLTWVERILAS